MLCPLWVRAKYDVSYCNGYLAFKFVLITCKIFFEKKTYKQCLVV